MRACSRTNTCGRLQASSASSFPRLQLPAASGWGGAQAAPAPKLSEVCAGSPSCQPLPPSSRAADALFGICDLRTHEQQQVQAANQVYEASGRQRPSSALRTPPEAGSGPHLPNWSSPKVLHPSSNGTSSCKIMTLMHACLGPVEPRALASRPLSQCLKGFKNSHLIGLAADQGSRQVGLSHEG